MTREDFCNVYERSEMLNSAISYLEIQYESMGRILADAKRLCEVVAEATKENAPVLAATKAEAEVNEPVNSFTDSEYSTNEPVITKTISTKPYPIGSDEAKAAIAKVKADNTDNKKAIKPNQFEPTSPDKVERIKAELKAGTRISLIAQETGVSSQTVYNIRNRMIKEGVLDG